MATQITDAEKKAKRKAQQDACKNRPWYRISQVWHRMKQFCTDPRHPRYVDYGGRGLTLDTEAWPDSATFASWAIANGWEYGLTVERKDNDQGYTPENVAFVTHSAQSRNTRHTVRYDYDGRQLTLLDIIEQYTTVPKADNRKVYDRIRYQMKKGLSLEDALARIN